MIESGQITTDKIMIHFISPPEPLVLTPRNQSIDQVKTKLKCIGSTLMGLKPLQNELTIILSAMFDLKENKPVKRSYHFDLGQKRQEKPRIKSDFSCSPMTSGKKQRHRNASSYSPPRGYKKDPSPERTKKMIQLQKGVGGQ
jgi:hypothetical protein